MYTVSVRELVEFVLRKGDLGGQRDFVASDRAVAGTRGHRKLQRSRPAGYQKEIRVAFDVETDEFVLRIQGRLDGLLVTAQETVLEEIKTTQGPWNGTSDPLHWAQARLYGFFCAQEHALKQITIHLTYLALETGEETQFKECLGLNELRGFFDATTSVYLAWIRERHEWCGQRDKSIRLLRFPFASYRTGQRTLAVAAYRTLSKGGQLFLEAPTGIGKTVSVLFPAVKAMGEGKLERIFYLTARTVGRAIAEKAFADMRRDGLQLRALTLTAKDKICVRDGQPCDVATCPMAVGYYDRIKAAMRATLEHEEITRPVLEAVGRTHNVCPFELSLDVSTWVDAVICDYNYVFDPRVYLRRHFAENGGQYCFLVDEAHNLVDRAREMFSADLDGGQIQEVRRAVKGVPRCAKALTKLAAGLGKLAGPEDAASRGKEPDPSGELNFYPAVDGIPYSQNLSKSGSRNGTQTKRELPETLLPLVEHVLAEAETWLVRNEPAEFRELLLELYFRLHAFRRAIEVYDERFVTIIDSSSFVRVRLFCLDPSFLLSQALGRGRAAVFFSATLRPIDYYRLLLGGSPEAPTLQLASPFPPGNLSVLVQDGIQTHFKAREATLDPVVEAIGALVQGRKGNYLVYFPSFKYLAAVLERFRAFNPGIAVVVQHAGMSEAGRDAFLAAFRAQLNQTLVGFAVMGGVFGEGIDLVGDHLIGAVIVGVGLPQLSIERDLIRDYFQDRTGDGFAYAYTFPGMNRVLQAVGRVIRCETDRGLVLLIDTRFRESRYRRLFPAWWQVKRLRTKDNIAQAVAAFWADQPDQGKPPFGHLLQHPGTRDAKRQGA